MMNEETENIIKGVETLIDYLDNLWSDIENYIGVSDVNELHDKMNALEKAVSKYKEKKAYE